MLVFFKGFKSFIVKVRAELGSRVFTFFFKLFKSFGVF